ncbi:MAG: hypothetical protein HZA89_03520 [Verrucomicrobia bacterium]|nr:hypothetical protein [Verrucomicrobiota bacterium]
MNATPSKIIRRTHMYLALFLTPWMIIYALSGLVLNHGQAVRALYGGNFAKFEKVGEREYTAAFSADADVKMIGAQILEHLGLAGTFNVQGGPNQPKLVINRNAAFAIHRITYFRKENRLLIEKQPFTAPAFVNRAHFRHGYGQPFLSLKIWAVAVDLVIVAMMFWIASGLWMWWEIRPARAWGAAFALVGLGVFGVLLATI